MTSDSLVDGTSITSAPAGVRGFASAGYNDPMTSAMKSMAALLTLGCLVVGCDTADSEQILQPSEVRTLTGLLRNDDTSPAGQTTGWTVTEDGTGLVIPADVTGVVETAQRMTGHRVTMKGTMMERLDAGGNKQTVFVAQTVSLSQ